eukprot:SM000243S08594  [mRNA]  locus=s243:95476:98850:- [translate_table: standard]
MAAPSSGRGAAAVFLLLAALAGAAAQTSTVTVGGAVATVGPYYVCLSMDYQTPVCNPTTLTCAAPTAGVLGLNLQNLKLLNLVGAFTTILQYNGPLQHATVDSAPAGKPGSRRGGSFALLEHSLSFILQDYISYGVLGGACPAFSLKKNLQSYSRYGIGCLTAERYDALANFASFTGSKMVFGLNVLAGLVRSTKGKYTGTWNPANTLLLLQYSKMKNYGIYGYSLGYEEAGATNAAISATSYAKYIMTLRTAINTVYPTGPRPLLIGPNIQDWNLAYAQQLLLAVGQQLDVFGYHSTVLGTGTAAQLAARAVDKAFLDKADATFASAKAAVIHADMPPSGSSCSG